MNILFFLTPKEEVDHICETDNMRQGLEKMERHSYMAIPLLSKKGKYKGTITEGDFLWYLKAHNFPTLEELERVPITDLPRKKDNLAVNVQEKVEDLFEKMTNQNFVPVVDDERIFIGIVTRKDVLLYMAKKLQDKK